MIKIWKEEKVHWKSSVLGPSYKKETDVTARTIKEKEIEVA